MRILGPIVFPSSALMPAFNPKIARRRAIRPQVVRDQPIRNERIFLQKLAHQFQRCSTCFVWAGPARRGPRPGVDRAPDEDHSAIDFQIDLIQMPRGARLRTALSQTGGDRWPEVIDPASNALVGDRDPALGEQVFDVSKAQRKPDVKPDCLLNDLRREPITGVADFRHAPRLPRIQSTGKLPKRDNAPATPAPNRSA